MLGSYYVLNNVRYIFCMSPQIMKPEKRRAEFQTQFGARTCVYYTLPFCLPSPWVGLLLIAETFSHLSDELEVHDDHKLQVHWLRATLWIYILNQSSIWFHRQKILIYLGL